MDHTPRPTKPTTSHSAWVAPTITALVIGLAFVGIYVGLQRSPTPDRLPLAIVGQPLQEAVASHLGDRVAPKNVGSLDAGRRLVEDGAAVGVIAPTSRSAMQFDYAGAAGLSESSAALSIVAAVAKASNLRIVEHDIIPLVRYDSRGLVTFYTVFGVTLSSFILAQALSGTAARVRLRHRLFVLIGFAVLIGVAAAFLADNVFGALTTPLPVLASVLVLLSAASAFSTKALVTWLGPAGQGLAVLILTVAGNATSGASIGINLLPHWAQILSNALPQGAAVRAIQSAGYFDGSAVWPSVGILAAWAVVGLLLVMVRSRRDAGIDLQQGRTHDPMQLTPELVTPT